MANKKIFIFVLVLLAFYSSNAQVKIVEYEQLALIFYRDSILPKYPISKKISITRNAIDSAVDFAKGYCFKEISSVKKDSITSINYGEYYSGMEIDRIGKLTIIKKDKRQFKFSTAEKQSKPCLRFTVPKIYENSVYMNIFENREKEVFVYYFKMDMDGNIQKWCSEELHIVTQY